MTHRIIGQCLAKKFDLPALRRQLSDENYSKRYKDCWVVNRLAGTLFIFDYGTVVEWSNPREPVSDSPEACLDQFDWLLPFAIDPLDKAESDQFSFSTSDTFRIHEDHIYMDNNEPLTLLAVSHGIAQSCKLASFESRVLALLNENDIIADQLVQYGTIKMSSKKIAKLRGQLFKAKSDIILKFDLLDVPEFFWEYPELESYYQSISRYLELPPRLALIQQKIDTLGALLSMLGDEQKHHHSSFLECIIIALIAVEIVIFLGHDLIKLF